jgi:hypothetical protein
MKIGVRGQFSGMDVSLGPSIFSYLVVPATQACGFIWKRSQESSAFGGQNPADFTQKCRAYLIG